MGKRKVANPLALAVLALLAEKPMHPYEMSSTLRERAKEQSIKLNYGSLYSVVESLVRHKLIEVRETVRDGRRPERTVYAITEPGRIELVDWMSELLAVPVKEYHQFEAALSLMPVLSPDEVVRLLETRRTRLDAEIAANDGIFAQMAARGMPYLWMIEADYAQVLRRAEREFVVSTIERLKKAEMPEIQAWRRAHEISDGVPGEADWSRAFDELGVNWHLD
ncbi:PadR family transcriptional regulator [Actinophytocola oryzae]|uniref:DNA-binding PadR family transcriptional regulator n=1 Tax=Actinophytocola oryzae TaxID=502181 RepID=A0A4V3FTN4_9PSEU|nr:PadR family transcriptional regulator [Actinophytocola oryzae]TDV51961.1 DNA-binding PadR family transcriptional regulator [Actinophytocola oryzae]